MRAGTWLALGAFGATVLLGLAMATIVPALRDRHRTSFAFIGGMIIWGVGSFAAWKLARLEPLVAKRTSERFGCALVRVTTLAFMAVSVMSAGEQSVGGTVARGLWIITGNAASFAFYLRVRQIAARIGAAGLAGQALMIAVVAPGLMQILATEFQSPGIYSPVSGWSAYAYAVLRGARYPIGIPLGLSLFAGGFAAPLAVLIQLQIALRRARRCHGVNITDSASEAANERKIEASSLP
jgi:hypothetical protein